MQAAASGGGGGGGSAAGCLAFHNGTADTVHGSLGGQKSALAGLIKDLDGFVQSLGASWEGEYDIYQAIYKNWSTSADQVLKLLDGCYQAINASKNAVVEMRTAVAKVVPK
ncbi:WXG100 family type VII secretion target [Nakamurella aerolata]|uniref:WXG100 family type VII secretion target n=1 Tax=Nakamurella aerolata TaxID=1656892 RepID=A0A849A4L4_9ACTN|nr:hypothetical protein [Nakamurella aerolata]NNG35934.1 hypothetical protein [Nakamurella aerolata]